VVPPKRTLVLIEKVLHGFNDLLVQLLYLLGCRLAALRHVNGFANDHRDGVLVGDRQVPPTYRRRCEQTRDKKGVRLRYLPKNRRREVRMRRESIEIKRPPQKSKS